MASNGNRNLRHPRFTNPDMVLSYTSGLDVTMAQATQICMTLAVACLLADNIDSRGWPDLPSPPTHTLTLNSKIAEMKNGSFSGLSFLRRLSCMDHTALNIHDQSQGQRLSMIHVLLWEAMLIAIICAAIRDQGGCLWSELPPEAIWKPMIRAAVGCYVQASSFCSDIHDCRLITENERHCHNLHPHPTKETVHTIQEA